MDKTKNRKVPLGKLPDETPEERKALAESVTKPAGQMRVRGWCAGVPSGKFLHHGKAKTIPAALCRKFWEAMTK